MLTNRGSTTQFRQCFYFRVSEYLHSTSISSRILVLSDVLILSDGKATLKEIEEKWCLILKAFSNGRFTIDKFISVS